MCTNDFNQLSLNDKILLINNSDSKLIESHPWIGKYKAHIYEMDGMKIHTLIRSDNKQVMLANALEDDDFEVFSDNVYLG